jgi:hypothetical protein
VSAYYPPMVTRPPMIRPLGLSVFLAVLVVGCGGAASPDTAGRGVTTTSTAGNTATTAAPSTSATSATTATTLADQDAPDLPLLSVAELPDGMPAVPVPAGGQLNTSIAYFTEESVIYEYPSGTLPNLVAFYEGWLRSQGVEVPPPFGSSPSRFWDVMVLGERVRIEIHPVDGQPFDRLTVLWYE